MALSVFGFISNDGSFDFSALLCMDFSCRFL